MPSFCAVSNCEQKYSHSENVSFHKFPLKNPTILAEWVKFTNRDSNWKPSRWNSICSRHFRFSDFREYLSRRCLKKDAIPSIITKSNISCETYHLTNVSPDDSRVQLEHDDYIATTIDESKSHSELLEMCRLCGERADSLTCNPLRLLDEPDIELMFRKCLPGVNIPNHNEHARNICNDCITQLRQYSNFIDKILSYQRELEHNENGDSLTTNVINLVNGNTTQCYMESITSNTSTTMFIKQEPINVKQEKVDISNRRPITTQVPMISPSLCLNPFAESNKIKGIMQQPKTEMTYCHLCDRIFGSNYEICSHECRNTDMTDREHGNNCEIMEVITLNNPVSFIDLADDENVAIEPRKLKTENICEFERKERLEFEHAYAKRPTNTSYNLKQEIIDSNNDESENGFNECNEPIYEHEDGFNQNLLHFDELQPIHFDCTICNESFVSQELIEKHFTNFHSVKPKICTICNSTFRSSFEYLVHKRKVHAQRFPCKQCKQKFNSQSAVRIHERKCTRESKDFYFSCRHCGKSIRNMITMRKHLIKCMEKHPTCMDEFSYASRKILSGNALEKYTCNVCNQTFSRFKLFKQHKECHQSVPIVLPEKVENETCSDARISNLDDSTNGDANMKQSFKFMVDDSKFIFLTESKVLPTIELNENLNRAFNGKFACDTCGRAFFTFVELKQHKSEHDAERKFCCSLCPKTFKGISGLKQHISGFHYKIKPYSCSVCGYAYSLKGDMQRCRHSKLKNPNHFKII